MNVTAQFYKVNAIGKFLLPAVVMGSFIPSAFAQTGLQAGLRSLCILSQTLLGVVVMVLIVMSGVIYSAGQVLGAETRARASVWATAMITGAVMGCVIYLVTPVVIAAMLPQTGSFTLTPTDPCAGM